MAGASLVAAVIAVAGSPGKASTTPAAERGAGAVLVPLDGRDWGVAASRWEQRAPLFGASVTPVAAVPAAAGATVLDLAAVNRAQHLIGTTGPWSHLCLGFVRRVFGLPPRQPSAIAAWNAAKFKHAGDRTPPAGVPVFWSGGGPGHVAVSMGGGWIVTSDLPSAGHVAEVRLSKVRATWHLKYLGWAEDLEGVRLRK